MPTMLTYSGGSITPMFVAAGSANILSETRTITHEILDGAPVYTLRRALPVEGAFELLFSTVEEAHQAVGVLGAPEPFTVSSDESPVLNGRIIVLRAEVEQADDVDVWVVTVEYRAVV